MESNKLNDFKDAYLDDFKYDDENISMLNWYANKILEKIGTNSSINILSLGIGHQVVSKTIIDALNPSSSKYTIIEGSDEIIKRYVNSQVLPENMEIVHSFFESYRANDLFDVIEMGFVLEHVDDPALVLNRFKEFLKKNGTIFIAVPNARSLHRMLGYHAGILNDPFKLSKYDLELGHKRYFDIDSIKALISKCELTIKRIEGIYLKPFTTDQLNRLDLPAEVYKALYEMGVQYPEISNSIVIEAGH